MTALVVFLVYLRTLPPTVTGEDSGELITAAYTLGIPHPPGYASWCLLTHPFVYVPIGTVAWRVALASAVYGTLAVFFTSLIAVKLARSWIAGIAAGLLFGFAKDSWEQFVIVEVYALNALFIAVCVVLLLEWYESRRKAPLFAFAFIYGLSLANHSTMRLLGPAFLLFVLSVDPMPWRRWKLYAGCIGLSLVGLSSFLYLPIRSAADPYVDWGNPETWENFKAVVTQEQFSFLLTQHRRSVELFAQQMKMFWDYYVEAFAPILVLLPLAGLYPLWRANRHLFGFVVGLGFLLSVGMVLGLNYGTDRLALVVNNVFFIPFYIVVAILAGIGVAWVGTRNWKGRSLSPVAAMSTLGMAGLLVATNYKPNDKSDYWFAYDFACNVFATLEPDALYFPSADHATFPMMYLQAVEGVRPDVTIANKYGYVEESLYAKMPGDIKRKFRPRIPTASQERFIEDWVVAHETRPVYLSEKRGFPQEIAKSVDDAGLLYRVVRRNEEWTAPDYWSEYRWHSLDPDEANGEFTAQLVLSDYHFARARFLLTSGDVQSAIAQFETSVQAAGSTPELFNNAGSALAEAGQLLPARDFLVRSIEANPKYEVALRNLGHVFMAMPDYPKAALTFRRLVEFDDRDDESRWSLVEALTKSGQPEAARDELAALADAHPTDYRVYRELGSLYWNGLNDRRLARQLFERSIQLNQNQPDLVEILRRNGEPNPVSLAPSLPDPLPATPHPPR